MWKQIEHGTYLWRAISTANMYYIKDHSILAIRQIVKQESTHCGSIVMNGRPSVVQDTKSSWNEHCRLE